MLWRYQSCGLSSLRYFLLLPGADGGKDLGGLCFVERCVGWDGDPAGRHQVIGAGRGPQVGVGSLNHVGQVLGPIVALWRDLDRLVVSLAEFRSAQHAEVNGPAMRNVADGVDDLALADLLEVLQVEQYLLAAGVDVHHGGVVGGHQGPASVLQPGAHVVRFSLAHCRAPCLLAAPASIASTKRRAVR